MELIFLQLMKYISSIDEIFLEKWKNMNWNEIFKKEEEKFFEKITNLVNNLKDFNKLFILLNRSKNDLQRDFSSEAIKLMQEKFISLSNIFNNEKYDTFEDDLVQLIFYSDQKKYELENFLIKNIQENINYQTVNNVYIKLLSTYKDTISEETKNIIINFFLENPNNDNPAILVNLINECEDLRFNLLENFDKYKIEKEKFWVDQKSDNIILFEDLLKEGYFNDIKYKNISYIESSNQLMIELYDNISNGDVLYKDINSFYVNNNEDDLNNKLNLVCLNDKEKAKNLKNILDEYIKTIKNILADLNLIYNDLVDFLYKKEKDNIVLLNKIILDISNGSINCYEKNYKQNYDEFINNFKDKAEIRALMKQSSFFTNIYKK